MPTSSTSTVPTASALPAPLTTAAAPVPSSVAIVPQRTRLELAPGKSCTFEWTAGDFEELDDHWRIVGVTRIATLGGGACNAGVLWDVGVGTGTGCNGAHDAQACLQNIPFEIESLNAGILRKPKAAPIPDAMGIDFVDWNFDGYRDLCVLKLLGAYNYSQTCWLYRPAAALFKRYEPLDDIIWVKLEPQTKTITQGMRLGGPVYMKQVLGWRRGELVVLERITTDLGGKPDGSPIPAGYDAWEIVERRKGGKLVEIRQGPTKN